MTTQTVHVRCRETGATITCARRDRDIIVDGIDVPAGTVVATPDRAARIALDVTTQTFATMRLALGWAVGMVAS